MYGDATWWILWIIVIIVIIWLVVAQKKSRIKRTNHLNPFDKTPLDILNEKYAKGEINKEEYEQKKKYLE